jgi:hypothetical protein
MKILNLIPVLACALLLGCGRSTSDVPVPVGSTVGKCPIHNLAFSKGPGKLPDGLTVSWTKEMHAAMEKYPYVRHDEEVGRIVEYCTLCETEVSKAEKL